MPLGGSPPCRPPEQRLLPQGTQASGRTHSPTRRSGRSSPAARASRLVAPRARSAAPFGAVGPRAALRVYVSPALVPDSHLVPRALFQRGGTGVSGAPQAPGTRRAGEARRNRPTVPLTDRSLLTAQIKDRNPIEEIVRERVPLLKQQGALWVACCPFHDEKTPSFKVDPRRGTWRCYGACAEGGDVFDFVKRFDHVEFREAQEILAARAGVELPRHDSARARAERTRADHLRGVLARAEAFFVRELRSPSGATALAYLRDRGLTDATIDAFGLGWAPAGGEVLVRRAREAGAPLDLLEEAGLARVNDRGAPYDFFRGRLTIPIRALPSRGEPRGATVGFGARRLGDEPDGPGRSAGPKYVNTPETPLFHKGRLVYGLDGALEAARRERHVILVEGYTDVMAAHQVGLRHVAAVLGTATTPDHAALLRRTGARRVTLCFDGDAAGDRASWRALAGLLGLNVQLDVVRIPAGEDPCDLLVRSGADAFLEHVERASDWFEFVLEGVAAAEGRERYGAIDQALTLLEALPAVERADRVAGLARALGITAEALEDQARTLPQRRAEERARERARRRAAVEERGRPDSSAAGDDSHAPVSPADARQARLERQAWERLAGALLLAGDVEDAELLGRARARAAQCPDEDLRGLLEVVLAALDEEGALPELGELLDRLGEHPARGRVVPLLDLAESAESPRALLEGELAFLDRAEERRIVASERARFAEDDSEQENLRLKGLHELLRRSRIQGAAATAGAGVHASRGAPEGGDSTDGLGVPPGGGLLR